MSNTDPQDIPTATGMEFCTTGWFNATVKAWNTVAFLVVNKDIVGAQYSTSFLACNVLSTTGASVTCRLSAHAVLENVKKKCVWQSARITTTNKSVERSRRKLSTVAESCEAIGQKMENIREWVELCAAGQKIADAATQIDTRFTEVCATAAQTVTQAQSTLVNLNRAQGTVNQNFGQMIRAQGKSEEYLGTLNEVVETASSIMAEGHESGEIMTTLAEIVIK
ncbi:hypothetical protein [Desulfovibrio sp. ZJ369]|uniref:hypothetical protein n=1 Tax=Desulfovibrio sp. ZJ369 TaxID=2709793 RepID=UPI0013EB5CFD|nr:hypothetical protein [Desulfovibrio sp. ZJ369]